jgi:hypothetical protein
MGGKRSVGKPQGEKKGREVQTGYGKKSAVFEQVIRSLSAVSLLNL